MALSVACGTSQGRCSTTSSVDQPRLVGRRQVEVPAGADVEPDRLRRDDAAGPVRNPLRLLPLFELLLLLSRRRCCCVCCKDCCGIDDLVGRRRVHVDGVGRIDLRDLLLRRRQVLGLVLGRRWRLRIAYQPAGSPPGRAVVFCCVPRLTSCGYDPCRQIAGSKPAGRPDASSAVLRPVPPALVIWPVVCMSQ